MDGILLFNKPVLWTSHDAVDFIRGRIGQTKVGHAGTLDPLATGLLVILVGKATKLSQEFSGFDKEYSGSMTLGLVTDTEDLEGRILEERDYEPVRRDRVLELFSNLQGSHAQRPPAYSAISRQGKRLYEWARLGVAIEPEEKEVRISEFQLIDFEPPEIYFSLTCSKGTYVRSLCSLVGRRLGCGATLSSLVRDRVGGFTLTRALTEEDLIQASPESIESRLSGMDPHENLSRSSR